MSEIKNESAYYDNAETRLIKSNDLLEAKFRASDLEQDIMNIAMTRIEKSYQNGKAELTAKLYPTDINQIINKKNNIYRDLKLASKLLTGHSMVIDTETGFHAFAIVTDCKYENSVLEVKFSNNLKPHLIEPKRFAPESVAMISLLKGYAKRMYEIVNVHSYKLEKNSEVEITYRISELKFMLGIANADEKGVQRYLSHFDSKEDIDWDYLYEKVAVEKMYEDWYKFRKQVIEVAQEEMEQKSNIAFKYKGEKEGRAFKRIKFIIRKNEPSSKWEEAVREKKESVKKNASEYSQLKIPSYRFPELYDEYIGHNNLTERDIDLLIEAAEYKEDIVRKAIEKADTQSSINNYMGWLLSCIRDGYADPIEVMDGSIENVTIYKEVQQDMQNPDIQRKAWEKITCNEDFEEFIATIGIPLEALEVIYEDNKEKIQMYVNWKLDRNK